jgi:DMSO/TMAO reductase YedYZ molybdopterin-dependent catalytic subunit
MLRDHTGRPDTTGFVVHGTDVETRWEGEVPAITPNDRFFVRNHTEPPAIDAGLWRLLVTGDGVARETAYSLADLQRLTTTTVTAALECTGNGRRLFAEQDGTPRPGTQWGLGAIGVARWTGVPLRQVLDHAGLRREATSVMAVGLDRPYVEDGVDHGRVRRPLPIGKALDDVVVAWGMNGEPLPADHGYPARLVVPGWVGIASIKWLGELRVTTRAETSPWNTKWYRMHGAGWEGDAGVLDRMPVKSVLDTTGPLPAGVPVTLHGRAWSGEASIRSVSVSLDGGSTWRAAELVGDNPVSGWTGWELEAEFDGPGDACVVTRAVDSSGRAQPEVSPPNEDGYLFCAPVRQRVRVD